LLLTAHIISYVTDVEPTETPNAESLEDWLYGDPVVPEESASRRWILWLVAAVTAISLSIVPLYNLFDRAQPQIAANGLEVCGFDYCEVQDGMRSLGAEQAMSRLSTTFLSDESAASLVASLVADLGEPPVALVMVDRLDGQIAGQYDSDLRTIYIERPATAWLVAHEVAHVLEGGHGKAFQELLAQLANDLAG
jgi:hypothetical protein